LDLFINILLELTNLVSRWYIFSYCRNFIFVT